MTDHAPLPDDVAPEGPAPFRLGYVPGATPAKWVRIWRERLDVPLDLVPLSAAGAQPSLLDGECDVAILRPPVDRDALHAIPLYEERSVVLVSRDHLLAALDEGDQVAPADLADEIVWNPLDDVLDWPEGRPGREGEDRPETTRAAIELVAAGVGVVVAPQSLARLHHRKDVTYRFLTDGPVSPVALSWVAAGSHELTEEFIGIVRGRTVNSSRGTASGASTEPARARGEKEARRGKTPPQARGRRGTRGGGGRGGAPAARRGRR